MTDLQARLQTALGSAYRIEKELGGGGMSRVFVAEETSLGRKVVVKVLPPEMAAGVNADRFRREIQLAASLQHPHIVPLLAAGHTADLVYYTMPLIEGESLRAKLVREGALPIPNTVRILRGVVDALNYAHRHGVVHRDIKPDNVLIAEHHALVTDFGVAKAVSQSASQSSLTSIGVALGTPAYMAPEQAAADSHTDHRADIYAVGVLGYEMLTGRPPFTGATPQAVLAAQVSQEPDPVTQHRRTAPPALAELVMRCLEKHPADRWQSAEELLTQLDAMVTPSGGTAPAQPVSRGPEAVRVVPRPKSIAVLPFVNLSADPENEYFTDGITEDIINALTKVEELRVASRTSAFAFKRREQDIRKTGEQLNVDTVLEGSVRKAGNRLRITAQLVTVSDGYHLWSERFDREVQDVFAIQDEIARAIVEALKIKLVGPKDITLAKRQTDNLEAYNLYLKGRYFWYQRGEGLTKALDCFMQATERDPGYAQAYVGRADCYNLLGFYNALAPAEAFPGAKSAAKRALELDAMLAEAHTSLAYARMLYDWEWDAAEKGFKRALELNPGYANTHHWYSEFLMAMGRSDEAIGEAKRAQELDPLGLIISTLLGMALYYARQYDQAIDEFRKVMDMDATVIATNLWLGLAYLQKQSYGDAVRVLERGCALPGARPYMVGFLGLAYGLSGRRDEAVTLLRDLEELSKAAYVSSFAMALVSLGLGHKDEALGLLERAFEERASSLFWLRVDPALDDLRSEPRFEAILGKMGLN